MDREQRGDLQRRTAATIAVAVISVGGVVCLLWMMGQPDATRLTPVSSSVRFNTGLCFILGGTGTLLTLSRQRRWVPLAIVPMLLLSGSAMLEYLLARDMGVDDLFLAKVTTLSPGRMAPNTAAGMLMAALGLAALAMGRSRIWALSIAAMLAALTVALGLVAVLGYAFELTAAFEWPGLMRMALLTAITLVALGIGIILATREVGRVASWLEQPWLASSVGAGAAGLGLLASQALRTEAIGLTTRVHDWLDAATIVSAALLAGTVAQARHMRLLSLQLAGASRRQAEQSAEISDLYENAPCGYHSLDAQARFLRINRTALAWLGYHSDQLVGHTTLFDLLTSESRESYRPWFAGLPGSGATRGLQLELVRSDGSILPVVLTETAVYDTSGAFHHTRSTLFDDSERRRFERALRDSELRLHLLIDNVQAAVVVHAADSSIEFANPRAADLLGLTREQMLGRRAIDPAWHFVREDGSRMPVEEFPVSRVISSGQALRDYVTGVQAAGPEPIRWVLVDAVPAIGDDGRLRQVIVSFIDISERQQQKRQLEHLASTDALTGLATRRHLLELAVREQARAQRSGRPLALIFFDLDHFKLVNDRFGHETGDRVLRQIGDVLRRELREADLAARWGGEEFCVMLPEAEPHAAVEVAERLRNAVERMSVAAPDGSLLPVTASFGVAMSRCDERDFQRVVDAADHAMYQAKQMGRNRVHLTSRGPDTPQ